ncbi:GGDEF domain-containing protein [Pseudoalteromonas sp. MMG005]|uniref:GGDEF domain-containing protein n=1 Tax=Pseudoalteromonas sp. MMG005 TaxID=2822682 RepID=UPI001B3A55CD|nr:GGDEF domain-containing protein [Pseudoalteromonas sp. MMG005]MBQ4845941.1 GGDEF domain-containing protein [Pseudoalteromonas sp. MMG005]
MPQPFIKLHVTLLSTLLLMLMLTLFTVSQLGTLKHLDEIEWIDSIGEGGIAVMTLIWLLATLVTRPKGAVTNLLFFGLSAMHISMLLDFLDEFFIFSERYNWLSSLEAFPAVIGMILMSFAMYYWFHEQQVLNHLLQKKERFYRTHGLSDYITGLYKADYMKQHIEQELALLNSHSHGFCLALFDIKNFTRFNQQYGVIQANNLLFDIGQIMTLNLRSTDLACRFASDCFIVLFPNTSYQEAIHVVEQVTKMVSYHTPYNNKKVITGFSEIRWHCVEAAHTDSIDGLLAQLNNGLAQCKASIA